MAKAKENTKTVTKHICTDHLKRTGRWGLFDTCAWVEQECSVCGKKGVEAFDACAFEFYGDDTFFDVPIEEIFARTEKRGS